MLAKAESKSELENIVKKDPFKANGLAYYQLTEFIPIKTCDKLKFLMKKENTYNNLEL